MRAAAALVAAVAAGALAGCGGDSDSGARDRFVARAQAICRAGHTQVEAVRARVAEVQRNPDHRRVLAGLADLTRRAADLSAATIDRLDALDPPPGDRDDVKGWIAGQRERLTAARALAGAYARGDQAQIATLAERNATLADRANAFAREHGLDDCAQGG